MTDEHEVIEISDDDDDELESAVMPPPKRLKTEKHKEQNIIAKLAPSFRRLVDHTTAPYQHAIDDERPDLEWDIEKVFADTDYQAYVDPESDSRLAEIENFLLNRFRDVLDDKGKVAQPAKFYRMMSMLFPKEQYMKLLYLLITGNLQSGKVLKPSAFRFASEEDVIKRLTARNSPEKRIFKYLNENGGINSTLRTAMIRDILDNVVGEENVVKMNVYDIWLKLATIFNYDINNLFTSGLGTTREHIKKLAEKDKIQKAKEEKRALGFYELLTTDNERLGLLNGFLVKDGLIPSARTRQIDRSTLTPKALFPDLYGDYSFTQKGLQDSYPSDKNMDVVMDEDNDADDQPAGLQFKGDLARSSDLSRPYTNLDFSKLKGTLLRLPRAPGHHIQHNWASLVSDLRYLYPSDIFNAVFPKNRGFTLDVLADMWELPKGTFQFRGDLVEGAQPYHDVQMADFSKKGGISFGTIPPEYRKAFYGNIRGNYIPIILSNNLNAKVAAKFLFLLLEFISDPYSLIAFSSDSHSFSRDQFEKINKTWVGIWDYPFYPGTKEDPPEEYFDRIERFIAYVKVDTTLLFGKKKSSLDYSTHHAIAVMILINENKVLVYDSSKIVDTPRKLHVSLMMGNPGFYRYIIKRMQKAGFKKPTIAVWRKSAPLVEARNQDYSLSDVTYPLEDDDYIANQTIFRATQMNPEGTCASQATYTCFFLALNPSFYAPPFISFTAPTRDVLFPMRHDKTWKGETSSASPAYSVDVRDDTSGLLSVDQFGRYIICCLMAGHILNFEEYTHTGAGIIKSKKSLPKAKKIK